MMSVDRLQIMSRNINNVTTIKPENSGDKLSVSFSEFYTNNSNDYLEIHDGDNVTAPMLAKLYINDYGTISASPSNATGSLTFKFVSDGNNYVASGWAAVIKSNLSPKNISQPGVYTLPSGKTAFYYDAGGPGANYVQNINDVTTIKPENSGDKLSVSFSEFYTNNSNDYLEIHDGDNVTAPTLAKLYINDYGTINASPSNTTGSLTFKFVSDGNNYVASGWAAVIKSNLSPKNISQPGVFTLPTGSYGYFYDAGGPGADYTSNMNVITTVKPEIINDKISVSFTYFQTNNSNDYLEIHDGSSITDPLLGTYSGTTNPGTKTSTASDGSLTFKFISDANNYVGSGWGAVLTTVPGPTGITDEQNKIPSEYSLNQNYPNPFNPTTTIKYSIPKTSNVELKVFDILGSEVAELVNEEKPAGNYTVNFNASRLPSGIYFYRIEAGKFTTTKKLILLK